jgi:hypothetical protein
MRGVHQIRLALLLTCLVALSAACFAQASSDGALTNADIVKMMKAGLPEGIIVREIRIAGGGLATTPEALIQLKKQGASERILGAALDAQGGPENYAGERAAAMDVTAQSAAIHAHHMPSFEANLRVNAKKREKVSVGKNQIKVEQSGVPVFSLKWKDPNPGK